MKASVITSSIILTAAEAKRAENTKSKAYSQLAELMSKFPSFEIKVEESKKKNAQDCVTLEFMRKYIESHEDGDSEIRKEFATLVNVPEGDKVNFLELKKWFFSHYPKCDGKHTDKNVEKILADAKARAEKNKEKNVA